MKILVTGGAGFIGSHITELLCKQGHSITVVDDLSFGYRKFVDPRAKFLLGSVGNSAFMEKALVGVDAVVHLAAFSILKSSFEKPLEYFQNNVLNGICLLEAMRKNNVKKIVHSSTAAVYGEPKKIPIKEECPKIPLSPYGASKLGFEEALQTYYHAFGIESISLRYFNVYGPRDEQQPATRAIPIWIKTLLKGEPLPLYWGGRQWRDYIYVDDCAKVHLDVLPLKGIHFYNIGSGSGVRMRNLVSSLESILGKKIKVEDRGERLGDPKKLVADITKIKKEVGWKPKTTLLEGLRKTYQYYAGESRKIRGHGIKVP